MEYGMKSGSSVPVAQQSSGSQAKASASVKSPTTTKTAPKPDLGSPTTTPNLKIDKDQQQPAKFINAKAGELKTDMEYFDKDGKNVGVVKSPIGKGTKPEAVVVQDRKTKKYSVIDDPDEEVFVANPDFTESKLGNLSKSKTSNFHFKRNRLQKKIKKLTRKIKMTEQGEPIFEINFNSKEVAQGALNAKIQCGFEAETVWPNLGEGVDSEDTDWLDDLYWNRVSDLIYDQEGSRSLERVEEGYREWLSEEIVYEFESEIVQELVNDRKEDEGYIDDFVNDQVSSDEVQDYKEEKLERLEIDSEDDEDIAADFEEYSGWDDDAWAREYVEQYREDDLIEWLEEQIRNDGEAWDDAWQRATEQYDMDDWCRREHGGSWWSLLGDYDIYLYNEGAEGGGVDAVASMLEDWASNNSQSNDVRPGGYHSGQGVDNDHWRVEDDSSIEGEGAKAEIISPVYDSPAEMLKEMKSLFEFMENNDVETNRSTGLHVTMSWMEKDWAKTNKLKMAVLLGDKYVLKQFGREHNTYTMSQQEALQRYIKNLQNDIKDEKSLSGLEEILLGGISDGKFSSINFKDARNVEQNNLTEFRVAGGEDYHTMTDKVMKAVIRYAAVMQAGHDEEAYRKDYVKALFKMIAGKDTVSGHVVKRAQSMVDPDTINDKVLSAFQSIASEKHYTDAIEALSNAYMQLADVQKKRDADPQSELQFEDEEETTDWRREMIKAQKYFVRAFAMLVTDVASGANRAPIKAAQISALRQATKQFGFNAPKLWQEVQQSEFYKNFRGDVHTKSEKFASAVNSLLARQDAKAQEAVFTVNFDSDKHRMFMPSNIADAVYSKSSPPFFRSDDNPDAQLPDKFTPDMFTVVPESDYQNVRIARSEYEKNMSKIENDMEIIDGFKARLKNTDPADEEIDDYKFSIQKRTEFVKKAQASALEDKKIMDQFAKKYGFVPATPSYGSEPLGKSMTLTNTEALEWISQNYNIKFGTNESKMDTFEKFERLPVLKQLEILESVSKQKIDEAWSKKYKKSIDCAKPKGFSQKAHCAGKKKANEATVKLSAKEIGDVKLGVGEYLWFVTYKDGNTKKIISKTPLGVRRQLKDPDGKYKNPSEPTRAELGIKSIQKVSMPNRKPDISWTKARSKKTSVKAPRRVASKGRNQDKYGPAAYDADKAAIRKKIADLEFERELRALESVEAGQDMAALLTAYGTPKKKKAKKESVDNCTHGKYYCSTDKKWKCRKSPKKSRAVKEEAVNDFDRVEILNGILADHFPVSDLKKQMLAYQAIPVPEMLDAFRDLRAQAGDDACARGIVKFFTQSLPEQVRSKLNLTEWSAQRVKSLVMEAKGLMGRVAGDQFKKDTDTLEFQNVEVYPQDRAQFDDVAERDSAITDIEQQLNSQIEWTNVPNSGSLAFGIVTLTDPSHNDKPTYWGRYFKMRSADMMGKWANNQVPSGWKLQKAGAQKLELGIDPQHLIKNEDVFQSVSDIIATVGKNSQGHSIQQELLNGLESIKNQEHPVFEGQIQNLPALRDYFGEIMGPVALMSGMVGGQAEDARQDLMGGAEWSTYGVFWPQAMNYALVDSIFIGPDGTEVGISSKGGKGAKASAKNIADAIDKAPPELVKAHATTVKVIKTVQESSALDGPFNLAKLFKMLPKGLEEEIKGYATQGKTDYEGISEPAKELFNYGTPRQDVPGFNTGYALVALLAKKVAAKVNSDPKFGEGCIAFLNQSSIVQLYCKMGKIGDSARVTGWDAVYPPNFQGRVVLDGSKNYYSSRIGGKFAFGFV